MSTYSASLLVINSSSQPISGTVSHWSGDGGNHSTQPFTINNLAQFNSSGPVQVQARNNHDDYWVWQPTGGDETRLKKNLDQSLGACVVITDDQLVVVTSGNGVSSKGLEKSVAAAQAV